MDLKLKLQSYITAESNDSYLYSQLATIANTPESKQILLEFAEDEMVHAQMFGKMYLEIFGHTFDSEIDKVLINPEDYLTILRDRVLDESGDYRKYAIDYITTTKFAGLKEVFFRASLDENVHTLRLLDIISGL